MLKRTAAVWLLSIFVAGFAGKASAATYALREPSNQRKLHIVRHYEIAAQKGKPTLAFLPAMMSFWGGTNWQIVESSSFKYSEPPDRTIITAKNQGEPRRYYHLTWNAPKADKITVEQTLEVTLNYFSTLYTSAKLPYAEEVLQRFSSSLGADNAEGINPNNPDLGPICDPIVQRSHTAEEVVEGVCDWINDNITFVKGQRTSDEALAQRQGSCTPMSRLACSMLRRIGIPAEMVEAKFIDSQNTHAFIEVYFPDAGWIFYDLSNWNRGFKSLDCLITVGWGYSTGAPGHLAWTEGYFCTEEDTVRFRDQSERTAKLIRKSPAGMKISGVTVVAQTAPPTVKPRQRPLKDLIMDPAIPPGPREYGDQ